MSIVVPSLPEFAQAIFNALILLISHLFNVKKSPKSKHFFKNFLPARINETKFFVRAFVARYQVITLPQKYYAPPRKIFLTTSLSDSKR